MDPLTMYGIGQGAQFVGNALDIWGEKKRRREQAARLRRTVLAPIQAEKRQRQIGPTTGEAAGERAAVGQTLQRLSSAGTLESSYTPGAVAEAVAPYTMARERQFSDLNMREAAAQQQIADIEGNAPGYEQAFAGAAGQAGQFLALRAGQKQGQIDRRKAMQEFFSELANFNPAMFQNVGVSGFMDLYSGVGGGGGTQSFGFNQGGQHPMEAW